MSLCRLSHDFFKYSSVRKIDGTKLVRMSHKVVESTGTHQDIRRALLEIWKIISSMTSTVHWADKQASPREFDFERHSVMGTASEEVSNIMDITTIWLVFSTVCFVTQTFCRSICVNAALRRSSQEDKNSERSETCGENNFATVRMILTYPS